MRVLAGGPARETESDVFRLHCEGLEAQGVFPRHGVVPDPQEPGDPRWDTPKIERVAKCRQNFMAEVERDGHDALFMVDTDVICGPGVLDRLMAVDADVVFGVFQTRDTWGGYLRNWPQVWGTHPYGFEGCPEMLEALDAPGVNEVEVFGGGACTLIRGRGFESHYWPIPKSLKRLAYGTMWGGEDRIFCFGCELRGIKMVAVTGLPIVHLHDTPKSPITPAHVAAAREFCGL